MISETVVVVLLLIWFSSRYMNELQEESFTFPRMLVMFVRSVFRSVILAGLFYALFTRDLIPEMYLPYLLGAYVIEPLIYTLFAYMNKTYSRVEMIFGNAKLPIIALREVMLMNVIFLFFTVWFKGVDGSEWDLLRVLYVIILVFVFVNSFDAVKEFNKHVLGKNPIGEFLEDLPVDIGELNLNEKLGHVVNQETVLKLSKMNKLKLEEGSIVIPIGEIKDQIKREYRWQKGEDYLKENRDRILFTLGMLIVFRLGSTLPIPGININALKLYFLFVGLFWIFT